MRCWQLLIVAVFWWPSLVRCAEVVTVAGNGQNNSFGDEGFAIAAGVREPYGITIGPDGALYICETKGHAIRRVDFGTGFITRVAGTGAAGSEGDGGPASDAQLNEPYEVRFDTAGNMYFVEMVGERVRRMDAKTGLISTIAGTGTAGFGGDGGPAREAQLAKPHSIALDNDGHLYICDIANHRIRRVDLADRTITTFAGTGDKKSTPDGAPIAGTPLNGPRTLDFDGDHNLYLALREGNAVYRLDLAAGTMHHLAGNGQKGYTGDGGNAREAALSGPKGIALAPNGDVYLADTESHTIRVIRQATGLIETVVGDGQRGDGPDGDPLKCRLARPHGVYVDQTGNVYIGDSENHKVRKLIVE